MEYEVCTYVDTPPQYLKLYKTLRDYDKCNVSRIVVIGSEHSTEDKELHSRLKEIYEDVVVEFIDREREKEKAEELIQLCMKAKHLIVLSSGGLR
jgi:hypothetical protein